VPAPLAGVLRLLMLIAVAVLPIALLACAAAVMSAAGHAGCGLGPDTSFRLALGLDALAAALGLRLVWAGLRLWRAGRVALVRGTAASAAARYPLDDERVALLLPLAEPVAYTAGLARPQVVVSRGLLALLDAAERRALLAHELAHARGGHPRMLFVGATVAEAYGFLPPVRSLYASLRLHLEAAADDEACSAVGDRRTVARAIAKASLAAVPAGVPAPAAGAGLRRRLARLEDPEPVSRPATMFAASAVLLTAAAIALSACLAVHGGAPVVSAALCLGGLGALVLPPLLRVRARPA
jgi:Zn-dependent protease with chaperone function